jgi:hypothetical protein
MWGAYTNVYFSICEPILTYTSPYLLQTNQLYPARHLSCSWSLIALCASTDCHDPPIQMLKNLIFLMYGICFYICSFRRLVPSGSEFFIRL